MSTPLDTITPYGVSKSKCGYCHDPRGNTSLTYGFSAESYAPQDYDKLMLHGWSRSGNYIYVPLNHKTCCPQYIIRLHTQEFAPTSSQRKAWRRFQKRLNVQSPQQLTITTEIASFTEEKYLLFKKYSMAVHKDQNEDLKESTFQRFLVDSPLNTWLNRHSIDANQDPMALNKYGTFHQLYRTASGELVGVGVQDIVPSGMISVYFYYDPAYKQWSLGRASALYEIQLCQQQGYSFYYMGYYVHSCSKMNYKRDYSPSYLLCPATYTWHPVPNVLPLLDRCPFTPFVPSLAEIRWQWEREFYSNESVDDAGTLEEQESEAKFMNLVKDQILESFVSIGSNLQNEIIGIDCSEFEEWEIRNDAEYIDTLVSYGIPMSIEGWNVISDDPSVTATTTVLFDEFKQYFSEKTQRLIRRILAGVLRYVGKDLAAKYPVYIR